MKLKHSLIPLIYFPSNIIFLDDDTDFLDTTKRRFERATFNGHFDVFDDADKAREWISERAEPVASHCLDFEESYPGSRGFDVLNQFSLFHEHDFNSVSLAVIDYAMPAKDGLTFAKELREIAPEVKILMLTGEADETMAINAFNEGLIDLFIKKESKDLAKLLLEASQKLVIQYFLDQTNAALANIDPTEEVGPPAFLSHADACAHILSLFPIHECQSFCLINEEGTFEAILKSGKTHIFKFLSEAEYDHMLEELKANLDDDDPELVQAEAKESLMLKHTSGEEVSAPVEKVSVDGQVYYLCKSV